MRFVFRADASLEIGSGHVMRLSAIAEEAILHGITCDFVGNISEVPWLEARVQAIGFNRIVSAKDYVSHDSDCILIIDSYESGVIDSFVKSHLWSRIIALIDSHTPNFEADLMIHPGLNSSWFRGDLSKLLAGVEYIPLRKSIDKVQFENPDALERIVVFGGGTDSLGFGMEIAKIICGISGFKTATFFSADQRQIQFLDERFEVWEIGAGLDEVASTAGLVFTTSGTSSFESLARGLPTGIACAVDNQEDNYKSLGDLGVAAQIGARLGNSTWKFDVDIISSLILNSSLRRGLQIESAGLIDLNGSSRIVEKILSSTELI